MHVLAAVTHERLVVGEREQDARPHERRRIGMARAHVVEVQLEIGDAAILGSDGREQRAHLGPGAVGADEQVDGDAVAAGEGQLVPPAAERARSGELVSPDDAAGIERADEQLAQRRAIDLGPHALADGRQVIDEDRARFVEDAHGLAHRMRQAQKLIVEAAGAQREQTRLLVHVEHAALFARVGGGVELVDGGGDAAQLEDARQNETAETGADDGDRGSGHERQHNRRRFEACSRDEHARDTAGGHHRRARRRRATAALCALARRARRSARRADRGAVHAGASAERERRCRIDATASGAAAAPQRADATRIEPSGRRRCARAASRAAGGAAFRRRSSATAAPFSRRARCWRNFPSTSCS